MKTNSRAYPFRYDLKGRGYEWRVWRPDRIPHHFGHYKSEKAAQRSADRINAKTLQQEDTATLVRTMRALIDERMIAQGQCFKDLTIAVTEISKELARRGYYEEEAKMNEKTKVIFRTDRGGITFALFPEEPHDFRGYCLSYEHIGQHGAADYFLCVDSSRLATEQEYAPLLEELQRIGYDLEIRKKYTPQMRDVFNARLAELRKRSK